MFWRAWNGLRPATSVTVSRAGQGVYELRIHWGAGYRVYYARVGKAVILLLAGGDKRTQDADIERSIGYLQDFKRRQK